MKLKILVSMRCVGNQRDACRLRRKGFSVQSLGIKDLADQMNFQYGRGLFEVMSELFNS